MNTVSKLTNMVKKKNLKHFFFQNGHMIRMFCKTSSRTVFKNGNTVKINV